MSGFTDLPREVRIMIYRYCLVSKYTIIPHSKGYEIRDGVKIHRDLKKFDLELLAVNRMVREEVIVVFYEQNIFYASFGIHGLSGRNVKHIRHARIDLSKHDLSPLDSVQIYENNLMDPAFAHFTLPQMTQRCHDERIRGLFIKWILDSLTVMHLSLKTLEIDVSNLYCPQGCCRLVKDLWMGSSKWGGHIQCFVALMHHHVRSVECLSCDQRRRPFRIALEKRADMHIRVTGIKDEDEAMFLHDLGFGCPDCPLKGRILDVQACASIKNGKDKVITSAV